MGKKILVNSAILEVPLLDTWPLAISLNQEKFRSALAKSDSTVDTFKTAYKAIDFHLDLRFKEGENIRNLILERAVLVDCLLHYAWHQFQWGEEISLVAVGGYGRGQLHPQSDIDILILTSNQPVGSDHQNIQQFVALLWDIGLNIGHSVRTLDECSQVAADDVTVVTNLIESRLLQGSRILLQRLQLATEPEHMWSHERFFQAKFNEQEMRHRKYNDAEYQLEPNVKNGPGALRDIQTIQWVAQRFFNVPSLRYLSGKSFFTDTEYNTLIYGEEFLWRVRYGLHMIAKRPEERLLFDFQKQLAKFFGYRDKSSLIAIEQFMREYYRVVLSLRELNDVLLQFLDEAIIQPKNSDETQVINERFRLRGHDIEVAHRQVFKQNPSALLEIFVLAAQNQAIEGIRASTIRLIRENCCLIDESFRQNPVNNQLFLSFLGSPYKLVSQLKRMKRYGILSRYLPEFDHIIGQMQHDLFHIYTVDDHTLNVIEFMRRFLLPDAEEKFPVVAQVAKQLPDIKLLYIAGLYHDIAKGRGGNHSILGAEDAIHFCERHQLSKLSARLIAWLVENHLVMSSTSQKMDLSDPKVIHTFAKLVSDQLHLDYLYVLTVADMNGTNPDIWNNWRASLLQQLYRETSRALRRGLENPADREERMTENQEVAMNQLLSEHPNFSEQSIWELWQTAGDDYFLREKAVDIVWHTSAILNQKNPDEPLVLITDHTMKGDHKVTQIFIRTLSNHNIFATATCGLDYLNLDVQDARIYTTVSGYTMDTFYVLDSKGKPVSSNPKTRQSIVDGILSELKLSIRYRSIIKKRTPRQMKHFSIPTRASISHDLSHEYTVLEVISPDRPGFLALIARIFVELDIALVTAKITTLGERVEDVFYITDKYGNRLSSPSLCQRLQKIIEQRLDAEAVDNTYH
ncbi:MAG: [protein-PII] uridylyltransferase [Cellvibrionaceae bacterium]